MHWKIKEKKLSDGSVVYDLVGKEGKQVIRLACISYDGAKAIMSAIEKHALGFKVEEK